MDLRAPFRCLLVAVAACAAAVPLARSAEATGLPVPDPLAQRALACTGCHGEQGRSSPEGYIPRLAGKPAGYLYEQLVNIRDGRRNQEAMSRLLENLTDDYLRELARHFAGLEVPYPPPVRRAQDEAAARRAAQLVREGDAARRVPACARCHGEALTGVAPHVPGLLGLPGDYLVAQLGAWRLGTRKARAPDCMAEIAQRLSTNEVAALARWLESQPVPTRSAPAPVAPAEWPLHCGSIAR